MKIDRLEEARETKAEDKEGAKLFQSLAVESLGGKASANQDGNYRWLMAAGGPRGVGPGDDDLIYGPSIYGRHPHEQQAPPQTPKETPPTGPLQPQKPRPRPEEIPPQTPPKNPVDKPPQPPPQVQPPVSWQYLDLKAQDRLAQAGVALVEQTIFSNFDAFPDKATGRMSLSQNGSVQLETPNGGREFVKTNARIDRENFGQMLTQITDPAGRNIQSIEQRWKDNPFIGQADTHIFVKDSDGALLSSIDGVGLPLKKFVDSSSASFIEGRSKKVEWKGQEQPLQIQFSAVNKGNNVLDIKATIDYVDSKGQPVMENGKPKPPSSVELILKVDPSKTAATYQIESKGF